jgi:aryl-alcohol dehydrogenase-like predicted oxidoreductase
MEKRTLGYSGLEVAPLAFGGNVFGWTADEPTSFRLLDAFIAAGFNLIDTADSYSRWVPGNKGGESETIIGKWMKSRGNRHRIVIATKLGSDLGDGKKGLSKNYMMQAVEDSLTRLRTDYIDLYQSHFDDLPTPVEETMQAYAELIQSGKVRVCGASNLSPERLNASIAFSEKANLPRYEILQPEYNLYERQKYESGYGPIVQQKGLGVITYFSLASGFLSGKYRSAEDAAKSPRGAGIVQKYLNDRGLRILKAVDEVAGNYNANPAAVSLAWLIARPNIVAPIASATTVEQLHDLTKAAGLKLDAASVELLNKASAYS